METANVNLITISYFVACALNAVPSTPDLFMQDGRADLATSLPSNSDPGSWSVWSPGPVTNLTQGVSIFLILCFIQLICHLVEYCPKCIFTNISVLSRDRTAFGNEECSYMSYANV